MEKSNYNRYKPSVVTLEGSEHVPGKWSKVMIRTPQSMRMVYPGAGSELFHGTKKKE